MTIYRQILSEFKKLGVDQDSHLQHREYKNLLNQIASSNAGFNGFDHEMSEELWDHTEKDTQGASVRECVTTIVKANNILIDQSNSLQAQLRTETDEFKRRSMRQEISEIHNDQVLLTAPFKIKTAVSSSQISHYRYDQPTQEPTPAKDLELVLMIALVWLLIELILLYHKHHFHNLMACSLVFSIFFLNYFDGKSVLITLGLLGLTCILDIVWMVIHAGEYWSGQQETQHSTIQHGFLRFIVFITALLIVVKIFIMGILFKYRTNTETSRMTVKFFVCRINLDGRTNYNLLVKALQGKHDSGIQG